MQGLKENQETVKKNVDILKLKMGYKVNSWYLMFIIKI
jgi:hypothetical protein